MKKYEESKKWRRKLLHGAGIFLGILLFIYSFWTLPFFLLKYGVNGFEQQYQCMKTKGRSMPVEYIYPEPGSKNVPLHSLVFVKFKENMTVMNFDGPFDASYSEGETEPVTKGVGPNYFYSGYVTTDINDTGDDSLEEKESDAFRQFLETAQDDPTAITQYKTVGAWKPNKRVIVQAHRACYRPLKFKFITAEK